MEQQTRASLIDEEYRKTVRDFRISLLLTVGIGVTLVIFTLIGGVTYVDVALWIAWMIFVLADALLLVAFLIHRFRRRLQRKNPPAQIRR